MELNSYQELAMRTAGKYEPRVFSKEEQMILAGSLGLAGEGGELIDNVKKIFFHAKTIPDVELQKELGDAMWYMALICEAKGWRLNDIARMNIEKLIKRYPQGFSFTQANLPRLD